MVRWKGRGKLVSVNTNGIDGLWGVPYVRGAVSPSGVLVKGVSMAAQRVCKGPVSVDAERHESQTTKGPAVPDPYPKTPREFSRMRGRAILESTQASQKGPHSAQKCTFGIHGAAGHCPL